MTCIFGMIRTKSICTNSDRQRHQHRRGQQVWDLALGSGTPELGFEHQLWQYSIHCDNVRRMTDQTAKIFRNQGHSDGDERGILQAAALVWRMYTTAALCLLRNLPKCTLRPTLEKNCRNERPLSSS